VYLALQQGVVDAQENPLPTIKAKKFYEVQKYINLTGHISDSLLTIIGGPFWNKLSEADRAIFIEELEAAALKASQDIVDAENSLAAWFEAQGVTVNKVDITPFREATMKLHNGPDATWSKDVYDRLQAIK
jgi:TRAP-type C4-dicarboxylate transport system substrate-binding protein